MSCKPRVPLANGARRITSLDMLGAGQAESQSIAMGRRAGLRPLSSWPRAAAWADCALVVRAIKIAAASSSEASNRGRASDGSQSRPVTLSERYLLTCGQKYKAGEARLRRIENIIGTSDSPAIAGQLHHLAHAGLVEYIRLSRSDLARHRLRVKSSAGNEYGIALPRSQHLSNGAVLVLEPERAVVVRLEEEQWLVLEPRDIPAALELGYRAGNMHWRVHFDGGRLRIAIDGEEQTYLAKLETLVGDRVRKIDVE
jgi:urease accessory protein